MEQYLQKGAFSAMMNTLGLRLFIALAALVWFIWLWGFSIPSVVAGAALGLLGQMAMTRVRRHFAIQREDAARRRLGGEMALEELLLLPVSQAHRLVAELLAVHYPLVLLSSDDDGTLCRLGRETLLVACLPKPADAELSCADITVLQRACRARRADRGVLCLACKASAKTESYAAAGRIAVRILHRDTLLSLLGQAAPATDEQLIALKARRKRLASAGGIADRLLHPAKARRYMLYGIGLMLLYVITGLRFYPIPAAICMGLGAASRCRKQRENTL